VDKNRPSGDTNNRMPEVKEAFKIVIIGRYSAGLETFIRSISELETVATDKGDYPSDRKVIFGSIGFNQHGVVFLLGLSSKTFPSASEAWLKNFELVIEERCLGIIMLIHSTQPGNFAEAPGVMTWFQCFSPQPAYVLAVTKADHADVWSPGDIRIALNIPDDIPIVPCVASDKESVKRVFLALLQKILKVVDDT
jgi:uncharacterized protein